MSGFIRNDQNVFSASVYVTFHIFVNGPRIHKRVQIFWKSSPTSCCTPKKWRPLSLLNADNDPLCDYNLSQYLSSMRELERDCITSP